VKRRNSQSRRSNVTKQTRRSSVSRPDDTSPARPIRKDVGQEDRRRTQGPG
jgi:hypothetical protein